MSVMGNSLWMADGFPGIAALYGKVAEATILAKEYRLIYRVVAMPGAELVPSGNWFVAVHEVFDGETVVFSTDNEENALLGPEAVSLGINTQNRMPKPRS